MEVVTDFELILSESLMSEESCESPRLAFPLRSRRAGWFSLKVSGKKSFLRELSGMRRVTPSPRPQSPSKE